MGCTPTSARRAIDILCLLAVMSGCAGNGMGLDANGQPLAPGSGGPPPLSADFESIQANIFTPICSVCHVGGGAPEGLRLDAANSYNLLVSVPSTEVPAILRVKPGDPDNSYIIQKLEGHAAVGAQMPFGGPYLSSATIAFIRQWITNGAPPASTTSSSSAAPSSIGPSSIAPSSMKALMMPASTPISVSGLSSDSSTPLMVITAAPANDDVLDQPPPQIMIGFNRDLDLTRLDANSARIERLSPDEKSEPTPMAAQVGVSQANLRALMLLPQQPLPPGRYRVLLHTTGADAAISTFDVEASP